MKRVAAVAVVCVGVVFGLQLAKACAPDFFRAVFSYVRHPDLPRSEFIDGRLGVLQPTFARSYLVIAYRYLTGIGMNPKEREQARDYYKDRDTGSWDHLGTDWPARWRAVRSRVQSPVAPRTSLVTGGQLSYDPETHTFALNCAEDAFRVAIHTLEARRDRFGAASPSFRSWISAQDLVFRNCDGDKPAIPQDAPTGLPALIRADREYQIASANFYAGRYEAALDRFHRISLDSASPWNTIARYLAVRTLLRMGGPQDEARLKTEAQAILSDPKLASIHGMTWNLLVREGIRETDQVYFQDLARLLSTKRQDDGLREELWNYTDLYDHVIGDADPNKLFRYSKSPSADVSLFRSADLTDWIFSFQSRDASVFGHCLTRWRQTRSPAWLLAALEHADAAQATTTGLLNAGAAIPDDSPAYLTARFHVLRLYEAAGDRSAARDGLDALLSGTALKGLPSTVNLFRGLRMLAAPSFEDFVRFAARPPVLVTLQMNVGEVPDFYNDESATRPKTGDLFDSDATRVLNRETPFRFLEAAALGETLPTDLRQEALMTAFTRGLMLDADLSELATKLGSAAPELASFTAAYLREDSDNGHRFAAAFLLLHRPEARPYFGSGITRQSRPGRLDPYRDNWWCPMDIEMELDSRASNEWYERTPNLLQQSGDAPAPDFLAGSASVEAQREMDRLGSLSAATDFLGAIVLKFAESHPDDPRVPESLYWLVRAGHYGCSDVDTWKTTRSAFQVLQLHYPKTSWAKQTPTWFKNSLDIRQEIEMRKLRN